MFDVAQHGPNYDPDGVNSAPAGLTLCLGAVGMGRFGALASADQILQKRSNIGKTAQTPWSLSGCRLH